MVLVFMILVVLMPVVLSINKKSLLGAEWKGDRIGCIVDGCFQLTVRGSRGWLARNFVLGVSALLVLVCVFGIIKLCVFYDSFEWMDDDMEVKCVFRMLDEYFGGSVFVRIVVYVFGGLKDREMLFVFECFE